MTSTYIEPIEDAIVSQLTPLESSGLKIENRPAALSATPKARAIIYLSDQVGDKLSTSGTTQPDTLTFDISVELTDQRTHQKAYPFTEAIRNALNGYRLTANNGGIVRFVSNQYQSYQDGNGVYWRYLMKFSVDAMWVKPNRK